MNIEERAQVIADGAKLQGPQTAPEIIADYERRLEQDKAMEAESRAQLEAGEILEEELYEGDPMLRGGGYPLLVEARVFGYTYAYFMPVPVAALRKEPENLQRVYLPKLRELFKIYMIGRLEEKRKKITPQPS